MTGRQGYQGCAYKVFSLFVHLYTSVKQHINQIKNSTLNINAKNNSSNVILVYSSIFLFKLPVGLFINETGWWNCPIKLYNGDLNTKLIWYSNGRKEVGCQMVEFLNATWIPDSPTIWKLHKWTPFCFLMYWSVIL